MAPQILLHRIGKRNQHEANCPPVRETQFAFTLGVIPADIHLGLRACFLGWFAWCLLKCKKAFKDA